MVGADRKKKKGMSSFPDRGGDATIPENLETLYVSIWSWNKE